MSVLLSKNKIQIYRLKRPLTSSMQKSQEISFNENFRTEILWDKIIFRTADTTIVKVKLLDEVKIYTNDSIPINLADNLIVKATKNSKGEWVFVKLFIFLNMEKICLWV